jgi:hypothetical protein
MRNRREPLPDVAAGARIAALPRDERTILAALAVVGRASLSADELAALVETADVRPLVDDLERRGLLRRDGERRYSLLGRIGADIRKLDDTIETADRLIGYVETLAHGGRLTPARLEQDAEAILGIAAWGAEMRRWKTVLELVKTVQASFSLAARFHEQRVLLELGRTAASRLGDRAAEIWFLQQLEQVADLVEDVPARLEYANAAASLARLGTRTAPARVLLAAAIAVAVGAAGAAIGFVVGRSSGGATTTTVTSSRVVTKAHTVTGPGSTNTVTGPGSTRTVTGPGSTRTVTATTQTVVTTTVSSVSTELVTTTVTTSITPTVIPRDRGLPPPP